jgi:hypothetical protein
LQWLFKSKQKLAPLFGFMAFKKKTMVVIGKVFQEGFLFVIESFLKTKKNYNLILTSL